METVAEGGAANRRDIIVIGASMGGVEALSGLVSGLPPDLPAAVLVVQHIWAASPGYLPDILARAGPLPAVLASDGQAVAHGRIYVAPPDRHLLLSNHSLRVLYGPRENRTRPAIDPLFRSAAAAAGSRVTGVILTGLQDDGAAGLHAVKECGGLAVVQSPNDAAYPEMPLSALRNVEADHVLPLAEIGPLLGQIVRSPAPASPPIPEKILLEAAITERVMGSIENMDRLGKPAPFTCRECGGALWEVDEYPIRYRCHVGHAFTAQSLLEETDADIEATLYSALRLMEERASMLGRMAGDERSKGRERVAADLDERAGEARVHVDRLRRFLLRDKAR